MRIYRRDNGIGDSLRGGVGGAMRFKNPTPTGGFDKLRPGSLYNVSSEDAARAAKGLSRVGASQATTVSSVNGNTTAAVAVGAAAAVGAAGVAALSDSEKTDERLAKAEGLLNMAGMAGWILPGAVGMAGGVLNKVGGWTNATWLKRAGAATKSGVEKYNTLEFNQLSAKAGVGGWFSKITQPIANVTGVVADKVAGWLGIKGRRIRKHIGQGAIAYSRINHDELNTIIGEMEKNLQHAPEQLQTHFKTMINVAKTGHAGMDVRAFQNANEQIARHFNVAGDLLSKEEKALFSQAENLSTRLGDTLHHAGKVEAWKNIKDVVKGTPKAISGAKVGHMLVNGAFVAGSAVSMVNDKRSFSKDIESLKQMAHDITGENYSTLRLLLGNVPKAIADVRWKLAGKLLAKETVDIANIGIQLSRGAGPMKGITSMMGVMALSRLADNALSPDIVPMYKVMSDAYKKGQRFAAGDYAQFLVAASKELENYGAESAPVQALATKYAAENISPAEIVKRASGTQLIADLNAIIKENEAKAPKAVSQVAKLQGTLQAAQPVVGSHTQRVTAQAQTASEPTRTM